MRSSKIPRGYKLFMDDLKEISDCPAEELMKRLPYTPMNGPPMERISPVVRTITHDELARIHPFRRTSKLFSSAFPLAR